MTTLEVSVLLATFRRPDVLERTLAAMSRMSVTALAWELVVVDNAGDHSTKAVCKGFARHLPIRYFVFPKPGKSAALNHGTSKVGADLVVLTDDDVLPEREWLPELV